MAGSLMVVALLAGLDWSADLFLIEPLGELGLLSLREEKTGISLST